jgi:bifunctional DNase/RNase
LTHDLMKNLLDALGHTLTEVRIVALTDNIYFASLVVDGGLEISARSSDAIALALRTGSPILVEDSLLDEAGVAITPDEDDEVERFREFLDHVTPEDFEKGGEPPP